MVFTSLTFLFGFLPVVLVTAWLLPRSARRIFLMLASLGFYAWGVQEFVLVVLASSLIDWALARAIQGAKEAARPTRARALLLGGLAQNIGLLVTFKYAGFLTAQASRLAAELGLSNPGVLHIALPIGISFFTFEKISYLVDVHRGDVQARRSPVDVVLFVSLFPRAIAGPIVRLREIQDDLRCDRPAPEQITAGAVRFSHGLAKKVLIADSIAPIVDASFAAAADGTLTTAAAWLGAVGFMLQLYYDFSGYSDMAIGVGMMLGFRFPENFNGPFRATSITVFWRRWHMTLSRWFRDYVYFPLGGSRGSELATTRNLVLTFVLVGAWHGAAWTYVTFGLMHGLWMALERRRGWNRLPDDLGARRFAVAWLRTMVLLVLSFVLFRAGTLAVAGEFFQAMFWPHGGLPMSVQIAATGPAVVALLLGIAFAAIPRRAGLGTLLVEAQGRRADGARAAVLVVVFPFTIAAALASTATVFLYFQF